MEADLNQAVWQASRRRDVRDAIDQLYRSVQDEIDRRQPICVISGRCCRFEEFGHRLYVTTLELARFVSDLSVEPDSSWDGTGCPFQRNRLCTVHPIRPFGCRMFFCDATSTDWQNATYARFHADLKRLHDDLGVPYFYVEWRNGLSQVMRGYRPV